MGSKRGRYDARGLLTRVLASGVLVIAPMAHAEPKMLGTPAGEAVCHHVGHGSHAEHGDRPGQGVVRSIVAYQAPAVQMTSATGESVDVREALSRGPVMLNFIYTSCSTVCPAMSATFSQVRERLGAEGASVRMISVSIDPENDTPARLAEYAARFHAGDQWQFLTGSVTDSVAVQRAFDAWRGNKMNHAPLTLLRAGPTAPWIRIEGYASAERLAAEMQGLLRVAARD